MKLSNLYGAQVYGADKKLCGYILAVCRDKNQISGYICCNERENEVFVPFDGARTRGKTVTLVKWGERRKEDKNLRLGLPLYSETGKLLGMIDDFTVEGNTIRYVHVGKKKFDFARVALDDVGILFNEAPLAERAAKDMFISSLCGM